MMIPIERRMVPRFHVSFRSETTGTHNRDMARKADCYKWLAKRIAREVFGSANEVSIASDAIHMIHAHLIETQDVDATLAWTLEQHEAGAFNQHILSSDENW